MKLYVPVFFFASIFIVAGNDCAQNGIVNILDDYYTLTLISTFTGVSPKMLRFYDGDIFYRVNNQTFAVRKDSTKEQLLKYKIIFDTRMSYVDDMGNKVVSENNALHMVHYHSKKTLRVIPENGYKIDQLTVDLDKSRVFFIGYDIAFSKSRPNIGRLYAFDTKNPNKVGGRIEVSDIKKLGNKIASIQSDKTSGKVALVIENSSNQWALYVLESVQTASCKVPLKDGIHKRALEVSIKLAGEQILKMYEEAVLGNEKSEILKRNNAVLFPNGGPIKTYFSSQIVPGYDPSASDKFDACGSQFSDMANKINKLETELKTANDQYEKLHSLVFASSIMKNFGEFKASFEDFVPLKPIPIKKVDKADSKYVCVVEAELKTKLDNFGDANSLVTEIISWLQFVTDKINSRQEEHKDEQITGEGIVEARLGE